eukprot:COSAG04_NODE_8096_length_1024_cov_0.887568_1_plen_189_part_01
MAQPPPAKRRRRSARLPSRGVFTDGEAAAGYLQLVNATPSPGAEEVPWKGLFGPVADPEPVTTLQAAQQRLAVAGICSARLGAATILLSDIAEMVAFHIRGFDHEAEQAKVADHGERAARARLQFRPRQLPAAGEKPEATGFLLEGHPQPAFNGVYRLHSEHEGWPVLKNANGMYCHRYAPYDVWFVGI